MIFHLDFSDDAKKEIARIKKSEQNAFYKLSNLLKELALHLRTGTGKPELMKYGSFKGLWSRRITGKHRLVYSINDKEVLVYVVFVKGHYGEK